jgi:hypothetical protein
MKIVAKDLYLCYINKGKRNEKHKFVKCYIDFVIITVHRNLIEIYL